MLRSATCPALEKARRGKHFPVVPEANARKPPIILAAVAVLVGTVAIAASYFLSTASAKRHEVVVYKHPQCGCCAAWVEHMEAAGFEVAVRRETDPEARWAAHDVPPELGSCHTATVGGYVIEGHVPAQDVRRLLEDQPENVHGLAVPGMPVGSPGMEGPNPQPFDVLLMRENGDVAVYRRHVFSTENYSGKGGSLSYGFIKKYKIVHDTFLPMFLPLFTQ